MNDSGTGISYFEESFPSLLGQGNGFVEGVLGAMQAWAWSDQELFAVELALVEAITNAIEHGNQFDPAKHVFVSCSVDASTVVISIRDEGEGFQENTVPDPREEDRLDCPAGRGVLLIRGFMTRVWYNDKGNELYMEKCRAA